MNILQEIRKLTNECLVLLEKNNKQKFKKGDQVKIKGPTIGKSNERYDGIIGTVTENKVNSFGNLIVGVEITIATFINFGFSDVRHTESETMIQYFSPDALELFEATDKPELNFKRGDKVKILKDPYQNHINYKVGDKVEILSDALIKELETVCSSGVIKSAVGKIGVIESFSDSGVRVKDLPPECVSYFCPTWFYKFDQVKLVDSEIDTSGQSERKSNAKRMVNELSKTKEIKYFDFAKALKYAKKGYTIADKDDENNKFWYEDKVYYNSNGEVDSLIIEKPHLNLWYICKLPGVTHSA